MNADFFESNCRGSRDINRQAKRSGRHYAKLAQEMTRMDAPDPDSLAIQERPAPRRLRIAALMSAFVWAIRR